MKLKKIVFAVAIAVLAPAALALPVAGLVNTGASVADNSQDGNYALTILSGSTSLPGSTGLGYAADQVGWPDASPWIGSNGTSKWLTPFEDEALTLDPSSSGVYQWRLTFDLTGYSVASTSFFAQWSADNNGIVLLNGVNIGSIGAEQGFTSWSSFSANTGFLAGINTLDFVVTNLAQNGGNPTGLRVEFLESSTQTLNGNQNQVPEPESYALLLGSLGLLGVVARRRQAK